jgi:NADPH2:quinone reductase
MKAVRFDKPGGPEVMNLFDVDVAEPAAGQVRVRQTAVGLNFIDTYHRSGLYPVALPSGLGLEAAGVVEVLGEGVTSLAVGDRVAYGNGPIGAYAQAVNVPANRISKIPEGISDETAGGMMLKGMTVRYLLRKTYEVNAGDTILLHAAAGGIGLIAIQWAKALGATVIGTVGSEDKAELAKAHGCDHIILYKTEDVGWVTEQIGPDVLLFNTDYPHVEGGRRPFERFERSLGDASEDIRQKFYCDNFLDLMGSAANALV